MEMCTGAKDISGALCASRMLVPLNDAPKLELQSLCAEKGADMRMARLPNSQQSKRWLPTSRSVLTSRNC